MQDECRSEIDQIPQKWAQEFPALPAALTSVLRRLIDADQRLQFLGSQLSGLERQLEKISVAGWTLEDRKQLQWFYRQRDIADREFHRNWKLLKQYLKEKTVSEPKPPAAPRRDSKPEAEPEPETTRVYEEPTLYQTVVVKIVDGKTITAMHPNNEEEMRVAKNAGESKRAIRQFEFPDGVPQEYHWVFPDPNDRRPGATRQLEISATHWRELAARETMHAEPCPLEPTRMSTIRKRLEEEGKL